MIHLGVLISGNGSNLQAILDAIASKKLAAKIEVVISDTSSAYGLERAKKAQIPTEIIERKNFLSRSAFEEKLLQTLKSYSPQWIVLAGFMRLLSADFLKSYPNRVLNIHPALLPLFPGMHAIEKAFEQGVTETGCTVHLVDEGCDTGPVLAQKKIEVLKTDNLESLTKKIHAAEHELYPEVLDKIAKGQILSAQTKS